MSASREVHPNSRPKEAIAILTSFLPAVLHYAQNKTVPPLFCCAARTTFNISAPNS